LPFKAVGMYKKNYWASGFTFHQSPITLKIAIPDKKKKTGIKPQSKLNQRVYLILSMFSFSNICASFPFSQAFFP